MSEYFRVLRRIEESRPRPLRPVRSAAAPAEAAPLPPPEPSPAPPRPMDHAPSAERRAAIANLFDNIRTRLPDAQLRQLVVAGASRGDPAREVVVGLAAHIERLGLSVLTAELSEWNGRPLLRRGGGAEPSENESGQPLDLRVAAGPLDLNEWLQKASNLADVILVEGRPLDESIDAPMLARSCDGLLLVARAERTPRDALLMAAERTEAIGCKRIGIAMWGEPVRLPGWLRQLLRAPRKPRGRETE